MDNIQNYLQGSMPSDAPDSVPEWMDFIEREAAEGMSIIESRMANFQKEDVVNLLATIVFVQKTVGWFFDKGQDKEFFRREKDIEGWYQLEANDVEGFEAAMAKLADLLVRSCNETGKNLLNGLVYNIAENDFGPKELVDWVFAAKPEASPEIDLSDWEGCF